MLDFYFYRPLTTQAFWALGQRFFGWNPLGYHLITYLLFAANIVLVYKLAELLTKKREVVWLATFLYAFSSTHFYRLFFLSQFQEIGLATFVLLTVILYIRKSWLAVPSFVLALMSKETAIIVPAVLWVYDWLVRGRVQRNKLLSYWLLSIGYVLVRLFFFGFASGGTYAYVLSPKAVLNNYFWYGLWSLGIPESFVNLKIFLVTQVNDLGQFRVFHFINPDLFTAFGIWGGPIVLVFSLFLLTIFLAVKRQDVRGLLRRESLFALLFFFLFLLPVAFFPFHKFAYSLTLPLFGVTFALAWLLAAFPKRALFLGVAFYLLLSFFTTQYNLSHHWATGKAYTAKTAFAYFSGGYPDISGYKNIYFQNDDRNYCSPRKPEPNLSQEVAYGIGGEEGLKLLYNKPELGVYFWDFDKYGHLYADSLVLDARLFLRR